MDCLAILRLYILCAEGKLECFEQFKSRLVCLGRRRDTDVHATNLVDLVVVDSAKRSAR